MLLNRFHLWLSWCIPGGFCHGWCPTFLPALIWITFYERLINHIKKVPIKAIWWFLFTSLAPNEQRDAYGSFFLVNQGFCLSCIVMGMWKQIARIFRIGVSIGPLKMVIFTGTLCHICIRSLMDLISFICLFALWVVCHEFSIKWFNILNWHYNYFFCN